MIFGSPAWLLAIPLVVAGVLRRVWVGGNPLAVPKLGSRQWTVRLALAWVPWVLELGGLVLLVVALARPQTIRTEQHSSHGVDLMVALDLSKSMKTPAHRETVGMDAVARQQILDLAESRPHDRFGLVVFADQAMTVIPPTADRRVFREAVEMYRPGDLGELTALGHGIALAAKQVRDHADANGAVIVVTDGRDTGGSHSPEEAIAAAEALGIQVHAIGIERAPGAAPIFGYPLRPLESAVTAAGGGFVYAKNGDQVADAFAALDELVPSPGFGWVSQHPTDRYRWPLVPGLLMLATSTLLGSTWLRRGP